MDVRLGVFYKKYDKLMRQLTIGDIWKLTKKNDKLHLVVSGGTVPGLIDDDIPNFTWEFLGSLSTTKTRSLIGAPNIIRGNFNCSFNLIKSLKGAPSTVVGNFDCSNNVLQDLKYAPKTVTGNFICSNNPGMFSDGDVEKVCDVKGDIITQGGYTIDI